MPHQRDHGFIVRPGVDDYNRFFSGSGRIQAVSFQFQQTDVVRTALARENTELITQRLSYQSSRLNALEDRTTASILAPNELTIRAAGTQVNADGTTASQTAANVYGLKFPYAFHMKMGASDERAYITTQNITAPLARNSTLETMLMLRSLKPGELAALPAEAQTARRQEADLAGQIRNFMGKLTERSKEWHRKADAGEPMLNAFARLAQETGEQTFKGNPYSSRSNLFINEEIAPMMGRVFETLRASDGDRMVMSMGEIGLLLDRPGEEAAMAQSPTATLLRNNIYELLENNQLEIITDQRRLWTVLDEQRELKRLQGVKTLSDRQRERKTELERKGVVDERFTQALAKGQIKTGAFGFHHDKSFAVFGRTGEIKALQIGSANLTKMSLVPLLERSSSERSRVLESLGFSNEAINFGLGITNLTLQQELSQGYGGEKAAVLDVLMTPNSAESVMLLASGQYFQDIKRDRASYGDRSAFLQSLNRNNALGRHYDLLAGRTTKGTLFSGQMAESAVDNRGQQQLLQLEERLKTLAEQTGGLIEVSGRYKSQAGQVMLMGLQVNFDPMLSGGQRTSLELTSNNQGAIILAGQNRIITGSVLLNREDEAVNLNLGGKTIQIGSPKQGKGVRTSVELDALDTTVAAVASIGRRLHDQSQREVPRRWWTGLDRPNRDQGTQLPSEAQQTAFKRLFASAIYTVGGRTVFNELGAAASFDTLMSALDTKSGAEFDAVMERASKLLASGALTDAMPNPSEKLQRAEILGNVFKGLRMGQVNSSIEVLSSFMRGREVMFEDLFATMHSQAAATDPSLQQNARDSARAAVKSITDAFLPTNQLGYSGMQARYRRPVMEVDLPTRSVDMSELPRSQAMGAGILSNLGVMAPGRFNAATKLDDTFIRLMGSTAYPDNPNMPMSGAYRTVVAQDREMNVGATAIYSKDLFRALTGLAGLSQTELMAQMADYGVSWQDIEWQSRKAEGERWKKAIADKEDGLIIWTAYSALRPEQLPQRLKNLLGTRPVLDISREATEYITSLGTRGQRSEGVEDMLSGRIMPVLAQEQFAYFKETFEGLQAQGMDKQAATAAALRIFRQEESSPNTVVRGILGGERARRVGISLGASFLGDFNYANPDYVQGQAVTSMLSVRFNSASVTSVTDTISRLSEVMAVDSFLISQPTELGDVSYRPGLYQRDGEGQLNLIASYDREGYFHVAESFRQSGKYNVLESIMLKLPSFSRRHQEDTITYIPAGSLAVSQQNTRYKVEMRALTHLSPDSTFRPGFGPGKGPMDFRDPAFFGSVSRYMSKRLLSQGEDETLYAIMSPSTMKGYRFSTGAEIFSRGDLRAESLQQIRDDIKTVAASIAFAFAGGTEDEGGVLKQALGTYLDERVAGTEGAEQARLRQTRQILSQEKLKGLRGMEAGLALPGLITLGGTLKDGTLDERFGQLRNILVRTIEGDAQAAQQLQTGLAQMMRTALNNTVETAGGRIASQGDVRVYSAVGFLEMLHAGSQILGSDFAVKQQNIGKRREDGSYTGRSFDDLLRFKSDLMHRQVTKQMAGVLGINLDKTEDEPELQRRLSFMQARVDSMFVLESLQEHMSSSLLVTMGGQREIDVEFQNIMTMQGLGVGAFYRAPSPENAAVDLPSQNELARRAFAVLVNMRLSGVVDYGSQRTAQTTLLFGVDAGGRSNMEALARSRQAASILLPGFNDKQVYGAIENEYAGTQENLGQRRFKLSEGSQWRQAENQFIALQQATRFQDPSQASVIRAATASAMSGGLAFFGPLEASLADLDQNLDTYVANRLGLVNTLNREEALTQGLLAAMRAYQDPAQERQSFADFLSRMARSDKDTSLGADRQLIVGFAQLLEEKETLKKALVTSQGQLRNLNEAEGRRRVDFRAAGHEADARALIHQAVEQASQRSLKQMEKLQSTRGKLYLHGMAALAGSSTALAGAAQQSYEVVLPRMQFEQAEDGRFTLRFDNNLDNAVRGFVAGYDVLEQMSLTYTGGAQHRFLDNQVAIADLMTMLVSTVYAFSIHRFGFNSESTL